MAPLIIETPTQSPPSNATHWSSDVGPQVRHRQVDGSPGLAGLKPHLAKTFKVSRDKNFVEKIIDVVGLNLNPPEHALVLCADKKTSVQVLDRTQPRLPLRRGRLGTMTPRL
jgi:hypothetical protein